MFNYKKQNYHHSKFPELGELIELPSGAKGIVLAFPLCDNVLPYSKGIHTCHVRRLDTGKMIRISAFYLINQYN